MLDIPLRGCFSRICYKELEVKGLVCAGPCNAKGEQQSWVPAGSSAAEWEQMWDLLLQWLLFCCSQLAADPDPNVKSGSELLDRLLKVFFLPQLRILGADLRPVLAGNTS